MKGVREEGAASEGAASPPPLHHEGEASGGHNAFWSNGATAVTNVSVCVVSTSVYV